MHSNSDSREFKVIGAVTVVAFIAGLAAFVALILSNPPL